MTQNIKSFDFCSPLVDRKRIWRSSFKQTKTDPNEFAIKAAKSSGEGNGVVFVQGAAQGEDMRAPDAPAVLPQVVLAAEHYGRLERILQKKVPVTVELNVQNRFTTDSLDSVNVIAEIPGTDKKDEIVMIGAHFDSWQAGTGATDNGISSAVMMLSLIHI